MTTSAVTDWINRLMIRHRTWTCAGLAAVPVGILFLASWGSGEQWAPALGAATVTGVVGIGGGLLLTLYLRRRVRR
jgi:hypothetical protein